MEKHRTVLYLHGYGSDKNSYTGNTLKDLFPQHRWVLETFDLLDVFATREKLRTLIDAEQIDTVVSSSLGSIYNLFIKNPINPSRVINKVLINPCCFPSKVLGNIAPLTQEQLAVCRAVETNVYQIHRENTPQNLFGIFAKNDELLQYHDFFVGRYGNAGIDGRITSTNALWVEGGHHHLDREVLRQSVGEAFRYFDSMAVEEPAAPQSEKPILYIDMDGTLVDFESGIQRLTTLERLQYDAYFDEVPGIFARMEPMPGAVNALARLSERYDVYILSTAPWRNPTACNDKLHWIHQHFGKEEDSCLYKRLILSHHKNLNRGEILIDDRPHKNGAEKFPRVLHFGVPPYDTWDAVLKELLG